MIIRLCRAMNSGAGCGPWQGLADPRAFSRTVHQRQPDAISFSVAQVCAADSAVGDSAGICGDPGRSVIFVPRFLIGNELLLFAVALVDTDPPKELPPEAAFVSSQIVPGDERRGVDVRGGVLRSGKPAMGANTG